MKDKIVSVIKERNGLITFKELSKKLMIDSFLLEGLLLELKLDGIILQVGNKYSIFPDDLKIGSVTRSLSGNLYIYYNDLRIPINSEYFGATIPEDIVAFKLNDHNEACIESIIDRPTKNITCEIFNDNGVKKIIPYHRQIKVILPKEDMRELLDGDVILVNIDVNTEDEYCRGSLIKRIGHKDDPNINDIKVALNAGFDNDYSDEYLEELKKIPKDISQEDLTNRTDYRDDMTVTIDGINTKDMDDAVFAKRLDNGNILVRVSISDVSHYVKPDSKLFQRAAEKTTSLYLRNSVFHMFHHLISNGICSLNPNEDRLTKTASFEVDKDGNVSNFIVEKSVIRSKKKMSYRDVDKVLAGENVPGYEEYVELLNLLNEAAINYGNKLERNGKIGFANVDEEPDYDSFGIAKDTKDEENDTPARKLIEHLMIATNEGVGLILLNSGLPGVFRVHETPGLKKVNNAIKAINNLGKRLKLIKEVDDPTVLQKILNSLKTDKSYGIISSLLLQQMNRARYSTENSGHYALALAVYTHFTSPIRRLADLLVHYILDILLEHPELIANVDYDQMKAKLDEHCSRASLMERKAKHAEADVEEEALIGRLGKHIGEEYEGYVLGIGNKIWIKVRNVDVYIDQNSLNSNFRYNKKKKLFYDYSNDKYLKTGARVLVRINSADIVNRSVKLTVLNILENENKKVKKKTRDLQF